MGTAPACRCQHNEVYWQGDAQYYAFGLGAASHLQSRRFSRPRGMGAYKQWVTQFAASGAGLPGALSCGTIYYINIFLLEFQCLREAAEALRPGPREGHVPD